MKPMRQASAEDRSRVVGLAALLAACIVWSGCARADTAPAPPPADRSSSAASAPVGRHRGLIRFAGIDDGKSSEPCHRSRRLL
jgi:hypothetical protein